MTEKEKIAALGKILNEAKENSIVFFGGAGVSTASNIPDFRSASGLWNEKLKINLSPEQLVSHTYYEKFPEEFFQFYRDKLVYKDAKPNGCHIALAALEKMGKLRAIVTQNIDGLHQMAGSKEVYELHGSVLRNYCEACHEFYDVDFILDAAPNVPYCKKCGGRVKPDVVLYEEPLDNQIIFDSIDAIENAETLLVGGTSLVVYPAAGLLRYFHGKNLVVLNLTPTQADQRANLLIRTPISEAMTEAMTYVK